MLEKLIILIKRLETLLSTCWFFILCKEASCSQSLYLMHHPNNTDVFWVLKRRIEIDNTGIIITAAIIFTLWCQQVISNPEVLQTKHIDHSLKCIPSRSKPSQLLFSPTHLKEQCQKSLFRNDSTTAHQGGCSFPPPATRY